jgi:DeoR/GlpR family transcriptional regulator of sugar metabolism
MAQKTEQRRTLIHEHVTENQMATVTALSDHFGVSEVSIRRDLDWLERCGLLKRVHGGAVAVPNTALGRPHVAKARDYVEEKERIGRAAAQMIERDDRVIFDSGTTVLQVARSISGELLNAGNLTAITNSLPVVRELGPWKGVHLIVLGGIYVPDYEMLVGPQTIEHLSGLHVDKVFLGTDGLTFSHGVTTANILEAEVDRAMVEAASEVIVVSDSHKIDLIGLTTILPVTKIDKLVTDDKAPASFVAALREQSIEVILA